MDMMDGMSGIDMEGIMDGSVNEMCVVGPGKYMLHLGQPQAFP